MSSLAMLSTQNEAKETVDREFARTNDNSNAQLSTERLLPWSINLRTTSPLSVMNELADELRCVVEARLPPGSPLSRYVNRLHRALGGKSLFFVLEASIASFEAVCMFVEEEDTFKDIEESQRFSDITAVKEALILASRAYYEIDDCIADHSLLIRNDDENYGEVWFDFPVAVMDRFKPFVAPLMEAQGGPGILISLMLNYVDCVREYSIYNFLAAINFEDETWLAALVKDYKQHGLEWRSLYGAVMDPIQRSLKQLDHAPCFALWNTCRFLRTAHRYSYTKRIVSKALVATPLNHDVRLLICDEVCRQKDVEESFKYRPAVCVYQLNHDVFEKGECPCCDCGDCVEEGCQCCQCNRDLVECGQRNLHEPKEGNGEKAADPSQ